MVAPPPKTRRHGPPRARSGRVGRSRPSFFGFAWVSLRNAWGIYLTKRQFVFSEIPPPKRVLPNTRGQQRIRVRFSAGVDCTKTIYLRQVKLPQEPSCRDLLDSLRRDEKNACSTMVSIFAFHPVDLFFCLLWVSKLPVQRRPGSIDRSFFFLFIVCVCVCEGWFIDPRPRRYGCRPFPTTDPSFSFSFTLSCCSGLLDRSITFGLKNHHQRRQSRENRHRGKAGGRLSQQDRHRPTQEDTGRQRWRRWRRPC